MVKYAIYTLLMVLLLVGAPVNTEAALPETAYQKVLVTVTRNTLHVTSANGFVLQIYSLTGACVFNIKIESGNAYVDVNLPKGCYIVKVGTYVRKLFINKVS